MRFNVIRNDYEDSIKMTETLLQAAKEQKDWIIDVDNPDYVFIVGGDGTFLRAVNQYNSHLEKIKFIPIKFGGIGFYTNPSRQSTLPKIADLFDTNKYQILEFPLLELSLNNKKEYAINEIKIVNNVKPIDLEVLVNNDKLEKFKGSGLTFSTASGSTGYTRSIGGAIIYPNIELFQMLELAPVSTAIFRTINSPIVFSKEQTITLNNLFDFSKNTRIIIDAKEVQEEFQNLVIKIANFKLHLISVNGDGNSVNKTKFLNNIFVSK